MHLVGPAVNPCYRDSDGVSHFVLFDDSHSLEKKMALAAGLGFSNAFISYRDAIGSLAALKDIASAHAAPRP